MFINDLVTILSAAISISLFHNTAVKILKKLSFIATVVIALKVSLNSVIFVKVRKWSC